jgi:hypothetical protein
MIRVDRELANLGQWPTRERIRAIKRIIPRAKERSPNINATRSQPRNSVRPWSYSIERYWVYPGARPLHLEVVGGLVSGTLVQWPLCPCLARSAHKDLATLLPR